jgi:hypothetical protein
MTKEVKYYEKEVEENTMKVQRMRDNNQDSYDIKKQVSSHSACVALAQFETIAGGGVG